MYGCNERGEISLIRLMTPENDRIKNALNVMSTCSNNYGTHNGNECAGKLCVITQSVL